MSKADDKLPRNDEEWRRRLTEDQYKVMRKKGTEKPFSGAYLKEQRPGGYFCAGCGQRLFDSDKKFDSGTGWPSFDEAIPGSIKLEKDSSFGMDRIEIVCSKCGSHLGHVFDDGPTETGKRYCLNSVCLDFKETSDKEGETRKAH